MTLKIQEMNILQYEELYALWQITSKRALSKADERQEIAKYLERNKGMSQVALYNGKIVGTVLAGHDGRRGYIHHMAVLPEYRRHGIANKMAEKAIEKLKKEGIDKIHIFTYKDNNQGQAFWNSQAFKQRDDLYVFSFEP